jgi:hypothetical protein
MIRLVISLAKNDKIWLQHIAEDQHVSMAEIIRLAIEHYRQEIQAVPTHSFKQILSKTKGIWKKGDGVTYQRKIRSEWDKK